MAHFKNKMTLQDLARRRGQTPCQLAEELGLADEDAVRRWCASEDLEPPSEELLGELGKRLRPSRPARTVEQVRELLKDVELPSALASDEPYQPKKPARKPVRKADGAAPRPEPEKLGGGDPGTGGDKG